MSRHSEPDVARLYHVHSSNVRSRISPPGANPSLRPFRFRTYPSSLRVPLPGRDLALPGDLAGALATRASVRAFQLRPMTIECLGRLLFACNGVLGTRHVDGMTAYARSTPSAGGLYPLELYIVCQSIESLPDGIYHYDARSHELERRRLGMFHGTLSDLTIGQEMIREANLVIVITALFFRTMWKYGQRGYRYVWLDAGHLGQNLYLVAQALGLGPVAIGGFFDHEVNQLLMLPADEDSIYLICIGQPKKASNPPA